MSLLVDSVTKPNAEIQTKARQTYAALLARQDAPQDGDDELLRDAMDKLDITPELLKHHAAAVRSVQDNADIINGLSGQRRGSSPPTAG